ncbi:MAG: FHA domain-containing protein [Anaerolineales bacterium]|nr:FHA domain-containing protein [Anaerolineales bacterium]
MITCPHCGNKELEGALFCKECGSQLLIESEEKKTSRIDVNSEAGLYPTSRQPLYSSGLGYAPSSDALVTLHLSGLDVYIPIMEEGEVIIGRSSEGQPMIPDIDLGKYKAFQSGVSRMHAAIRLFGNQILISDLGSSNGTSVNETKLEPYSPHPLKNGDVITLGRMRIEVITKDMKPRTNSMEV